MSEEFNLSKTYTLTVEQILHGLATYTYQFDGYAEYAKGWADDGLNLFLWGTDPEDEAWGDYAEYEELDEEDSE